uniref:DUF1931 domain-containing protein n=1 Tax=Candidatus Kentrum sp. SD TaxID=2126332 RepID=A0A450YNR7_9GAMM|nr:MAG: hypothetical protein BECKSD772F_GA0070984_11397 [Candidatus Kentron sp. SD]VFK48812.1 MAG: hypothetical protein BECKSD772E_GA0070983_11437 [Candidatus Kentron sp. SD]VFK80628.1 MAG: hypothetical protein BECKSD772D_GA0070982_11347 [Candidatus Kentron sp. SD]
MADKAKTKKTTKKAKAPTKAKANKAKMLVVETRVKAQIKEKGEYRVSTDFYEALSKAVQDLCNTAVDNAKECGRKTLQAKDV